MSELDEMVGEFLVESYENLDALDADLLALERDPGAREHLASVFRTVHTIKGTCGFLGFGTLESVTHAGENLLSLLRDGELTLTPPIATTLLALGDAIRTMLGEIETTGSEGTVDYSELVATLTRLAEGGSKPDVQPEPDPEPQPQPEPVIAAEAGAAVSETRTGGVSDSTIRVDVGLLDELMNLVGELVLSRNQILQFTSMSPDSGLVGSAQRLNLIATELQEGVMKTRMQPIGNVWGRFPRIVRDLAVTCGKEVSIEMEGEDTELDKTIIEAIKDPLTHLVRNAVDHGVETAAVRRAAGKPAAGTLSLHAYHEGGQVNIEIVDDGAGIDPERVLGKALERGIVTREQASSLGEREILGLIFAPGFSTAERVTNVSGRGVGMDVVKTNIERIGGTVDIASVLGRGTTFKVKIPLTLAIIPALIVSGGQQRYAIPQVSLLELVRLEGEHASRGIERISGAPVHRLRGNLLPLVYLNAELGVEPAGAPDVVNIVVLQADGQQFGLVVDRVHDTQEIVVKPLGSQIKGIPTYAGTTILGDGRVALILDVLGLAQRSKVVSEARERRLADATERFAETGEERQTLLVVGLGSDRRVAIPLSDVARLEKFERRVVERAGQGEVVQYRGEIMPLYSLSAALGVVPDPGEGATFDVVVHTAAGRSFGLVVDRIVDIVEDRRTVDRGGPRGGGSYGSQVIQRRVTDLVDIPALVAALDPSFALVPPGVAAA